MDCQFLLEQVDHLQQDIQDLNLNFNPMVVGVPRVEAAIPFTYRRTSSVEVGSGSENPCRSKGGSGSAELGQKSQLHVI